MTCDNRAGKLRFRVTLQSCARVSDGQGGYEDEWSDERTLWAGIEPLDGYEKMQAMQAQSPVTHKMLIRYNANVTAAKRFRHGGRILDIKEVLNEEERNLWMKLRCVETIPVDRSGDWNNGWASWDELSAPWAPSIPVDGIGSGWQGLNANWESMD